MKSKHEQLYVAVQDLLIELSITPKRLRDIAANQTDSSINPKTARKLINADLIVEEINWRKPSNVSDPHQEDDSSVITKNEDFSRQLKIFMDKINSSLSDETILSMFDKIKSSLSPNVLWEYLQEKHPDFLHEQETKTNTMMAEGFPLTTFNKIKLSLAPIILWSYLREEHPEFLFEQIKEYLFPTQ
jgi:hypothetical protein